MIRFILLNFLLFSSTTICLSQDYYRNSRKQWLQKAEQYKPELVFRSVEQPKITRNIQA